MRKNLLFTFILFISFLQSQEITFIPSPPNATLENGYQAMTPIQIFDNYLYCYTIKTENNIDRFFLTKVNITTDEVTLIPTSLFSTANGGLANRPMKFQKYKTDIYFICGNALFKLDTINDTIIRAASYCFSFYIYKDYLIYDDNTTKTYIKNLLTNSVNEVKTLNNSSFGEPLGFYEYDNNLYFRSYRHRIEKFIEPSQTQTIYSGPNINSSIDLWKTIVREVNGNLVYLLRESNSIKFVSINTQNNTKNFSFDTLETLTSQVKEPFILNGKIYFIDRNDNVYSSNGVNEPVSVNMKLRMFTNTIYKNNAFGIINTNDYGNEVWKTDGTGQGTQLLKDINIGTGNITWNPIYYKNLLLSPVRATSPTSSDFNIYVSDGTNNGTFPILSADTFSWIGYLDGNKMSEHNDRLYTYAETSTQRGLFKIDISQLTLGINNTSEKSSFKIFPNPTNSIIYLNDSFKYIEVYDFSGKLINSLKNKNKIDLQHFNNGVYFIKVINENGEIITRKVIKK